MGGAGQSTETYDYTLSGNDAAAEKEDMLSSMLLFAEEYDKFAYNSQKQVHELQEPLEHITGEGEHAATARYTSCKIEFDRDGRLVRMEFFCTLNYGDGSEARLQYEADFSNYGTTVVTVK